GLHALANAPVEAGAFVAGKIESPVTTEVVEEFLELRIWSFFAHGCASPCGQRLLPTTLLTPARAMRGDRLSRRPTERPDLAELGRMARLTCPVGASVGRAESPQRATRLLPLDCDMRRPPPSDRARLHDRSFFGLAPLVLPALEAPSRGQLPVPAIVRPGGFPRSRRVRRGIGNEASPVHEIPKACRRTPGMRTQTESRAGGRHGRLRVPVQPCPPPGPSQRAEKPRDRAPTRRPAGPAISAMQPQTGSSPPGHCRLRSAAFLHTWRRPGVGRPPARPGA